MKVKILIVDDESDFEQLIRQKYRRQIREQLYEFIFAANGVEALELLESHRDTKIVFSDINMPIMDGLTLLTKMQDKFPLLRTVIVSAYSDMENIRLAMNRGAFDFICKPIQFDDLETTLVKTLRYVTQIHETVRAIKENNILKMYVDNSVIQFMSRSASEDAILANETINATVVFMDICGFANISEKESQNFVVNLINKYFDVMVNKINDFDGYVDKFMGDAVMAVFKGESHINKAIKASLAVHKAIEAHKETLSDNKTFLPRVAIGINSGEMISGNIGSIALKRLDFTVIGDVVNTSQRLQSIAKAGQTIITKDTYEQIKNIFNCNLVGEMSIKNKQYPMEIYEVLN
ncbi:MAG: adenylate/guanylate cyclase domain-containing protein [Saprospiraceae bacterium]